MSITTDTNLDLKDILYFNTTRNYTLAILDSFNNVKHWVKNEDGFDVEKVIPIKFGNYEKSIALEDISEDLLNSGNFNFIPRMILSFNGMTKVDERVTSKFTKISKTFRMDNDVISLNYGHNSVPYDFQYTLNIQARGLNEAFQIVEQIIARARPNFTLRVREYPLFDQMTETRLQIEDPEFEIMDEFEKTDVNIVNVIIGMNLRGNLYMPLQVAAPIKVIKLFNYLWDTNNIKESQLTSYYEWEVVDGIVVNNNDEWHDGPMKKYDIKEVKEIISEDCEIDLHYDAVLATEVYDDINTENDYDLTTENPRK